MRWHRAQQLWLALASVVPGFLVYKRLVQPAYAALMLVVLYFLSKRHAFLVQRQFEREEHGRKVKEAEEKQRLAALPKRKRRDAERAKRLQQNVAEDAADDADASSGSDSKENSKDD